MHFLPTLLGLLAATTTIQVLAAPLTFDEIERRWSAGESDASIHALHNPRTASPAWPLAARSAEAEPSSSFAESYDAVTQQEVGKRNDSSALMAKIRDFATRLLKSKGESQMIAEKKRSESEEDEAPVLRPRKVVYQFSA